MRKLVVAHRGDRKRGRENTVEAFQGAIECGADMIEFDVRRTADRRLVIHHDAEIDGQPIANFGYVELLGQSSYKLALLSDVLQLATGKIQLDVELKEPGYEQDVVREILDHGFDRDHFVLTSFQPDVLKAAGEDARTGLLVENMTWEQALELYHAVHAEFLAPEHTIMESTRVPLLPWSVNGEDALRRMFRTPAVFGVITDEPEEALRIRASL